MLTWLRGLCLLRFPEVVKDLGERRLHALQIREIAQQGSCIKLHPDVRLVGYESSRLEIENGVTIESGTVLAFGDQSNGFGRITIGQGSWIGQYNNLRSSGDADIRIGNQCLISQFCTLVGTNHSTFRLQSISDQGAEPSRKGVSLGDDVWLGAGSVILPGVKVGMGAVIGANAVVNRDVPEYEIWGGVPAKRIGKRQ